MALLNLGRYGSAEAAFEEALQLATRLRDWRRMQSASLWLMYVVGQKQERPEEGLRYRALAEELARDDPEAQARTKVRLGEIYAIQGRFEDAQPVLEEALQLAVRAFGPRDARIPGYLNALVANLHGRGRYAEAEELARRGLEILDETLGPEHPDTAKAKLNLATVVALQSEEEEAEALLHEALPVLEAVLGPNHPYVAAGRNTLGELLVNTKRYEAAEIEFWRALEALKSSLGPEHPRVAMVETNLAAVLVVLGKGQAAVSLHTQSLERQMSRLGPSHPDVALSWEHIADAKHRHGDHEGAEDAYRRALEIREQALEPGHVDLVRSRTQLAAVLLELERADEALEQARRAWSDVETSSVTPEQRGETALAMAQALWSSRGEIEIDSVRSFVAQAITSFEAAGEAFAEEAEVARALRHRIDSD